MPAPRCRQGSLKSGAASVRRELHTSPEVRPSWRNPALVHAARAVPELDNRYSEDSRIVLVLLSFLSTEDEIPLELLSRGATPRERWTEQGEIETVNALDAGLDPELCTLLSDTPRLHNILQGLVPSSTILQSHDQTYTLNEPLANRIHHGLPTEDVDFWKLQALILAYRAIPWKYAESA